MSRDSKEEWLSKLYDTVALCSKTGPPQTRLHEADVAGDVSLHGPKIDLPTKFDRAAYQREYMRKRRAAQRAKNEQAR